MSLGRNWCWIGPYRAAVTALFSRLPKIMCMHERKTKLDLHSVGQVDAMVMLARLPS